MYGSNVGHHADLRLRDFRQRANLAGVRHAHFDDRNVVLRFQLQEHERQAEMIIEVAFGLEHAEARAKNMRDGFFGRRFPCGAGDADQRLAPDFAHRGGQRLQRNQRIVDGQQAGLIGIAMQLIFAHDGCQRLLSPERRHVVVAVEPFALDCEKEFSRRNRARVDGIALRNFLAWIIALGDSRGGCPYVGCGVVVADINSAIFESVSFMPGSRQPPVRIRIRRPAKPREPLRRRQRDVTLRA